MIERVDAVVVGAGVMGAMTAWRLARRGRSVVLLEQFSLLHANGSSHGQTRIFRVAYRDARYTPLSGEALALWRDLEHESNEHLLEQSGQLDHGEPEVIDEIEAGLAHHGWSCQRLTPDQAAERWPGMVFDRAVVFSPDGGRLFADRSVAAAVRLAQQYGATVHDQTTVERIEPTNTGARVHTARCSWDAATVVLCAGPWLPDLAANLVNLPPLTITQQQPVHFAIHPGFHFPSFVHHSEGAGPLAFGAYGLESPGEGVKVGIEATLRAVTPATRTYQEDPAVTAVARQYAEEWLPGADVSQHSAVTCLFTETVDSHFILRRQGPVVVCSPCSGHGFKFAPAIGERTAQLAVGDMSAPPLPTG
ncbi:MAG: FAD-dependent oxidoreductase [Actinomycetales bacterium]